MSLCICFTELPSLIWLMAEMGKEMGLVADVKGARASNKSLET